MDPSQNKGTTSNDDFGMPQQLGSFEPTIIQPTSQSPVQPSQASVGDTNPELEVTPLTVQTSQVLSNETPTPAPIPTSAPVPPVDPVVPTSSPVETPTSSSTPLLDSSMLGVQSAAPVVGEPVAGSFTSQPMPPASVTVQATGSVTEPNAPVFFASDPSAVAPAPPVNKHNKKKLFIIGGAVGLMVVLVATGVFGFYLPNRPSAVWNTGINRTGKALDSILETATSKQTLQTLSTSKIDGEINATVQGATYSGTLTSKFKDNDSDSGLTLTMKSADQDMNVMLKALTETVKDSDYPNAYIQFTGLKSLGIDMIAPGLGQYEGKWISIPAATYQKWAGQYAEEETKKSKFSSADVTEITQTAISVTNDYVFSTNPEKAVIQQNSFVGKETVDGMKTYHYKVSLNKQHAKDYCAALVTEITKTKAYENITGYSKEDIESMRKDGIQTCKDGMDDIRESDVYDMWIDGKYKLIYKVRVNDKDAKGDYQEYGQRYTGGDVLTFFYNMHSKENESDVKATVAYNTKTFVTTMTLEGESKSKDSPFSFDAKVTFEPSKDEVKITAPKDAVPIETILQQLGFEPPVAATNESSTKSIKERAADSERQTDINALNAHVEANYAMTGEYPTLAQINDANWRKTNMKGLDTEALVDPSENSRAVLVGSQTKGRYAYVATGCGATGCESYTLIAVLSDGTTYEKTAF